MTRRSHPSAGSSPAPTPQRRSLAVEGVGAPVVLTVSHRARRLTLRVDPTAGVVRLTVPPGVEEGEARRFVDRHAAWVRPSPGCGAPSGAVRRRVRGALSRGSRTGCAMPAAVAPWFARRGNSASTARRSIFPVGCATTWCARRRAKSRSGRMPRRRQSTRASPPSPLRDTRSRWGSCSADGRLNFSWRLILAPEPVLDYVVAHEVAHLRELNHSARFWAVCARLCEDVSGPKIWLKRHGAQLHRYG